MTAFKENALNAGELASCDRVSLTRLIPSIILAYYPLLSRAVRSSLRCGTPQHGLRCGSTKKKGRIAAYLSYRTSSSGFDRKP
ncbi:hypothetical protein J6513_004613 [Escherichia coli]|nr:hypothetical protein [Escherichia coli]